MGVRAIEQANIFKPILQEITKPNGTVAVNIQLGQTFKNLERPFLRLNIKQINVTASDEAIERGKQSFKIALLSELGSYR